MNPVERKAVVFNHYFNYFEVDEKDVMFYSTNPPDDNIPSIDIMCIKPNKKCPYCIMATAGLSNYKMEGSEMDRVELIMALDPKWKFTDELQEFSWPLKMLLDTAYGAYQEKLNVGLGKYFINSTGKPYNRFTNAVGGIVAMPEMFDESIFPIIFEDDDEVGYVLGFTSISDEDVKRIDEGGVKDFIEYYLHNVDGPNMVVSNKSLSRL